MATFQLIVDIVGRRYQVYIDIWLREFVSWSFFVHLFFGLFGPSSFCCFLSLFRSSLAHYLRWLIRSFVCSFVLSFNRSFILSFIWSKLYFLWWRNQSWTTSHFFRHPATLERLPVWNYKKQGSLNPHTACWNRPPPLEKAHKGETSRPSEYHLEAELYLVYDHLCIKTTCKHICHATYTITSVIFY